MDNDTIAAIASPPGQGGIGIIRISGPDALSIGLKLFRPRHSQHQLNGSCSHKLIYGNIIDRSKQQTVDEALVVYMAAPNSYTCEDVVEIQSHGGPVVLGYILSLVLANGARLAAAGEFTQRAFLNGRIDLSQAEAVADIIDATSSRALTLATQQLDGRLKSRIDALISDLTELLADLEASIEFPDDVGEPFDRAYLRHQLSERLLPPIQQLADSFQTGRVLKEGLRLAIVGRPNVGKSSLLNALLDKERAIVTDIPGTTRDTIEEQLLINGIPIVLTDTAGLHDSTDPVESIGMRKTRETIDHADLVLFVIDATQKEHPFDAVLFSQISHKPLFLILNKIDLVGHPSKLRLSQQYGCRKATQVSALNGTGINQLKEDIAKFVSAPANATQESVIITNARHSAALLNALGSLRQAYESLGETMPEDLVAMDFHNATRELKTITGEHMDGDLLDFIFKRFCIGK